MTSYRMITAWIVVAVLTLGGVALTAGELDRTTTPSATVTNVVD